MGRREWKGEGFADGIRTRSDLCKIEREKGGGREGEREERVYERKRYKMLIGMI